MTVTALGPAVAGPPDRPRTRTGPWSTFGRIATDLRVSLTDRCNRCTSLHTAEGLDWLPASAAGPTNFAVAAIARRDPARITAVPSPAASRCWRGTEDIVRPAGPVSGPRSRGP